MSKRQSISPELAREIINRLGKEIAALIPLLGEEKLACIYIQPAPAERTVVFGYRT